jgi:hypothetical protein
VTETLTRPRLDAADEDLLRAFEPVVRFTRGESFLPMTVDAYIGAALRLRAGRRGRDTVLAERGSLTPETLGDAPDAGGGPVGREFITVAGGGDADDVVDLFRPGPPQAVGFRHVGGRLARVGYTARLIDAVFSLALLARGRVPGSLARRAVARYRSLVRDEPRHPYYGRVVRTAGWTVLQYWFFYAFNDWRSGFNGANDHEADWEQVLVYLDADADGSAVPVWVAYAQHDEHGRDLRRRWDDSGELELVGDHPVVYAGAGSHASYFRPGDYLTEQELRLPRPVSLAFSAVRRMVQGGRPESSERVLGIAFVDYARGDGVSIGPESERAWSPVVLDEAQPWVAGYRGLWGLSVQDPFQGEDAPAGPMFNRDGTIRRSWSDPVGFAELDLEPPPSQIPALLDARMEEVTTRQAELAREIPKLERNLAATGAARPVAGGIALAVTEDEAGSTELARLRNEREENALALADLRRRAEAVADGWTPLPRAHLRRIPVPAPPDADRVGLLLETWAAVSIGLLMLALVAALLLAPRFGVVAAIAVIGVFVFIESVLRSRVVGLVTGIVRVMAIVAGSVLIVTFWQEALIALAIAAGLFVLRENLAELVAGVRSGR